MLSAAMSRPCLVPLAMRTVPSAQLATATAPFIKAVFVKLKALLAPSTLTPATSGLDGSNFWIGLNGTFGAWMSVLWISM